MHIKWPPIAFMAWDICPQYNISNILALMHSMLKKTTNLSLVILRPFGSRFLDKSKDEQARQFQRPKIRQWIEFYFLRDYPQKKPPEFCCGVQLSLLSMMRWSACQSWSPIGQESDKIIGNHFDIWHSQLTEYIHINLCGFWQGGVHESLQTVLGATLQLAKTGQNLPILCCSYVPVWHRSTSRHRRSAHI